MAPIKFDDTIKDKLEKRSIQPSSNAWNALSSQLDSEDKKNSRGVFFYIGIAASIVGVLLVTTLFFKSSEKQAIIPTVVETTIEQQEKLEPKTNPITAEHIVATSKQIQKGNNQKEVKPQGQVSVKNDLKVAAVSKEKKADQLKTNPSINVLETKLSVAAVNTSGETQKEASVLNELTFEEAKAIEVVAHIKKLEIEKGTVTDAEIEALLKQAEREIFKQRIYNETTRTVDANALLQDVEDDLEKSFRTKVFETLKSNYKTVKTAVAERNN